MQRLASFFRAALQSAHQAPLLVDRDYIAPLHRHDHADLITLPLLDAPVSRESPLLTPLHSLAPHIWLHEPLAQQADVLHLLLLTKWDEHMPSLQTFSKATYLQT